MNDTIGSHQGHGFEALLPFIVVDPDPQVVANAALKTAVLFRARHADPLEGPRFVARLTGVREHPRRCGAILGGLMLIGDERLTPLIHETWDAFHPNPELRLHRVGPHSFSEPMFCLIDLLEWYRCSEVFHSLVAWLKTKGLQGAKLFHVLRKLHGSEMVNLHCVFVASTSLRHANIGTTTQFYTDRSVKLTAGFALELSAGSVTPFPGASTSSIRREDAAN